MVYLLKSTTMHYPRSDITVSRTRFNQNRNRLLNNLTCNFNHSWLMICLAVLRCCINPRDSSCDLTHYLSFLNVVRRPYIPILKWTVPAQMGSSTFPTLDRFHVLLWISWLFSHHSRWLTHSLWWILLLILEVRRFETFLPLVRILTSLILLDLLVIRFSLAFLIAIFSFHDGLF